MDKKTPVTTNTATELQVVQATGIMPADTSGWAGLGSSLSIDRVLTRFGWLGEADEVLARVGLNRTHLRALEADEEIFSNLETRRFAAINTPWRFEHPQSRVTKFFTDTFAPHMDSLLTALWGAVPYGYSVVEVVYTEPGDPFNRMPGRFGIGQVIEVPFEWIQILPAGVMVWRDDLVQCDPRKFFACVNGGNLRRPSGDALLSKLYWPWFFRTHGWKMWAKHMERVAVPFLYGKTNGDRDTTLKALSNAVQDAVLVSGSQDDVTVLDMGTAGNTLFPDFETAVTRRLKMAILGQTLTSGTDGGSGNRALGQVHNEVRMEKKRADVKMMCQTVQRIVNTLAALNGMEPPMFVMEDGSGLELERAERDKILYGNGVRFTHEYIREKYGMEESDFTITDVQPTLPAPQIGLQNNDAALADSAKAATKSIADYLFVDGAGPQRQRFTPGQQAIEDQIDRTISKLPSPIQQAAILSAINGADSPDDLINRLAVALQDSDTATIRRVMERALYAADLMGYGQAQARAGQTSNPG